MLGVDWYSVQFADVREIDVLQGTSKQLSGRRSCGTVTVAGIGMIAGPIDISIPTKGSLRVFTPCFPSTNPFYSPRPIGLAPAF